MSYIRQNGRQYQHVIALYTFFLTGALLRGLVKSLCLIFVCVWINSVDLIWKGFACGKGFACVRRVLKYAFAYDHPKKQYKLLTY